MWTAGDVGVASVYRRDKHWAQHSGEATEDVDWQLSLSLPHMEGDLLGMPGTLGLCALSQDLTTSGLPAAP
jgi:hypothetical protein